MKVLVVASQKGGSGKTTLAGHLAVQAEMSGSGPVGLIDVDPQGSLADWWNERTAPNPFFIQTAVPRLADDIRELAAHGMELLIIDTPPALTATIADVIRVADLVVIPTRPSPHDLRSIGATMELVEHLGKPLVFVVNGAAARARITNEAVTLLSQYGPLAPSIVHQRVDFAAAMIDGRTVMELPGESRSADEIAELWSYLQDRLEGGGMRRRRLPSIPGPVAAMTLQTKAEGRA
ncbi:ParA family protein [Pelagibius sp. CAU 1746]|uniref:ParA family protein n=1 Tax=Pelagibius sp. CAU 1746 TaxID=3140370 RepID=UPI00325B8F93